MESFEVEPYTMVRHYIGPDIYIGIGISIPVNPAK